MSNFFKDRNMQFDEFGRIGKELERPRRRLVRIGSSGSALFCDHILPGLDQVCGWSYAKSGHKASLVCHCILHKAYWKILTFFKFNNSRHKFFLWIFTASSSYPFVYKVFLRPMIGRQLDSMYVMEEYLFSEAQDLDYTIVRPPRLMDGPLSGKFIAQDSRIKSLFFIQYCPKQIKKRAWMLMSTSSLTEAPEMRYLAPMLPNLC